MKINISIDQEVPIDTMDIKAQKMTPELASFLEYTEQYFNTQRLTGRLGDKVYLLELKEVVQFLVEEKHVMAITKKSKKLKMNERLYQLETMLPHQFVRISKSEIINLDEVDLMQLTGNGLVKIVMKNTNVTYASRRYLKRIKEMLEL